MCVPIIISNSSSPVNLPVFSPIFVGGSESRKARDVLRGGAGWRGSVSRLVSGCSARDTDQLI